MTALEKIIAWVATYPNFDVLGQFRVDYTDQIPSNGAIFPSGLMEISRTSDIVGNAKVVNQYNFGVYCVFAKPEDDDIQSKINADWVMDFQEWVQEQSARRLAPVFGDVPQAENIKAQNGMLYSVEGEGTATYMVQLSVQFNKIYEVKNIWLI